MRITQKGQVTIPEEIRNKYGFLPYEFSTLQKQYFDKIDLSASPGKVQNIPKFSAQLSALADKQQARLASIRKISQTEKEQAGLIFIYDGFLTSQNNFGVIQGKLSLTSLTKERRFAKLGRLRERRTKKDSINRYT